MGKHIFALMLLLTAGVTGADETNDSDLSPWAIDTITPIHDSVTRWVDNTARNIDGFFGTIDSDSVDNESYLRLSTDFDWAESEEFDIDPGIRFKLDVPTTEERLRLIIESDPEESRGTLEEQGAERLRNDTDGLGDTVAGLSRLGSRDKREGWHTRVGAGVKLHWPVNPYLRYSAERLWQLGDSPWQLSSYNRASWFEHDGYSARSRWDVGRPLDSTRHLRFVSQLQWQEDYDQLEFSQSTQLNIVLGKRSAIRYSAVIVGGSSSNPRVNDYYLQTDYRRDIHRQYLYWDIVPALHFPREADFKPRWAISLRLEMLFRAQLTRE
ncbi:hypothetical protein [Halopseudomonas aestusnigri]|uniref:Uncharacterized protein n=1 Tax=Halopseudomonas aestusnigri TaxID=857252 RepID=A0AAQ1JPL5_9GAMM|nr:hypothetical protein [Halopseudomonas aestusnigri]OWL83990.1 hypothetical protein B7O88_16940 [Halopseudomonas aestusnigri]SEG03071.1 hypothetical protein SAMN05216586_10315 [Halopseudomonas aestusnigri]